MSDPREHSQAITFLALLFFACLLLCGVASAAPSLSLSKKSGPPTSGIRVSGRGFEPNVGVDIYFDTKDEALVITNGKGEFDNAKAYAPRSAHPGKHWVTALERNNDKGAQEPFLVQTDWSQFHFDADGTRLNPYENVLNPKTVRTLDLKWTYQSVSGLDTSPAIANGVLYLAGINLYALNSITGAVLWSYGDTHQGMFGSPAVANGVVYIGSGDLKLHALNANTGVPLWSYTTGFYVESSPAVANGVVYVGSDDYNVYALNAITGSKLWSYGTGSYVISSPAVANGVVYVGSWDGNLYALNASTGAKLWNYLTGGLVQSSPVVSNGVVYVSSGDNNLYALDAIAGFKLWSYPIINSQLSSPAVANGVVYMGSDDHNLYALNAQTGVELWRFNTGWTVMSSPAVADGVVYIGSNSPAVFALDANNGTELWSYLFNDYVNSPVVANGIVYVGVYAGPFYAFASALGDGAEPGADSKRPEPKALRPDFTLKVSNRGSCRNQGDYTF